MFPWNLDRDEDEDEDSHGVCSLEGEVCVFGLGIHKPCCNDRRVKDGIVTTKKSEVGGTSFLKEIVARQRIMTCRLR